MHIVGKFHNHNTDYDSKIAFFPAAKAPRLNDFN